MLAHEVQEKHDELLGLAQASGKLSQRKIKARAGMHKGGTILHFVRHGQGEHNVFATQWREKLLSSAPDVNMSKNPYVAETGCPRDPDLTAKGREVDARAARAQLSAVLDGRRVPCIASPLRRTLQTASLITPEQGFEKTIVLDAVREHYGLHVCDSLRSDYDRLAEFPVDWSYASE